MKKIPLYLRRAGLIFKEHPIGFSLSLVLIILSLVAGNYVSALALVLLTIAEVRIVILKSKIRVLGMITGAAVVAALGGMFRE